MTFWQRGGSGWGAAMLRRYQNVWLHANSLILVSPDRLTSFEAGDGSLVER